MDAVERISDGVKIGGSVYNLDYAAYPDPVHHNDCTTLKYGFFGVDYSYQITGVLGENIPHGHVGGIVAASNFSTAYATELYCITDWAFGAGYHDMNPASEQNNIQAHWWGAGNTYTSDFRPHGLFIR